MSAKNFHTEQLYLDTARENYSIPIAGHYFRVIDSSDPNAEITVRVDNPDDSGIVARRGFGWKHSRFERLWIDHAAQAGEWVRLIIGGLPNETDPDLFDVFPSAASDFVQVTNTEAESIPTRLTAREPMRRPESGPVSALPGTDIDTGGVTQVWKTVSAGKELVLHRFQMVANSGFARAEIKTGSLSSFAEVRAGAGPLEMFAPMVLDEGDEICVFTSSGDTAALAYEGYERDK